ncbi:hypothetical protein [Acerihabitans arboris]|uniref:Uncharacterized protein n=1 Tax=Acerihabitans arboris TaxID=2691583 RepID=A0A845SI44_9GAMM|nr:hypothetical protein [Acerihabitans arboris]NDL62281.1 hypothetical protein [Acerihabitans arboris]
MVETSPASRTISDGKGADNGISRTQVSNFMTIRKYQLGVIIRPVLLLFTIIILFQSMENARKSAPLVPSALPAYYSGAWSPAAQAANPFCPVSACAMRYFLAQCPCTHRQHCLSAENIRAVNEDKLCQQQDRGDRSVYRFIKTDMKQRVKRAVRRLLRLAYK